MKTHLKPCLAAAACLLASAGAVSALSVSTFRGGKTFNAAPSGALNVRSANVAASGAFKPGLTHAGALALTPSVPLIQQTVSVLPQAARQTPAPLLSAPKVAALADARGLASLSDESLGGAGKAFFDQGSDRRESAGSPVRATQDRGASFLAKSGRKAAALGAMLAAPALAFAQGAKGGGSGTVIALILLIALPVIAIILIGRFNYRTLSGMIEEETKLMKAWVEQKRPALMNIPGVVGVEAVPMTLKQVDDQFWAAYVVVTVDHLGADNQALLPQRDRSLWSPMFNAPDDFLVLGAIDNKPVAVRLAAAKTNEALP